MRRLGFIIILTLAVAISVFADIARPNNSSKAVPKPKESPSIVTTMEIKMDRGGKEARLLIPKSQIKQLRAELENLDVDTDNTAAVTNSGGVTRIQTMMSGMFLSLAIVFGGIWFVRSGKANTSTGKSFVVLAVVVGIASAATLVYANVGPPPEARNITSKLFDQRVFTPYQFASGKIKLEASDDNYVRLVVPDPQTTPKPGE